MPHIHTKANQHDMTVSAYILRRENNEWRCMVHYHKKIDIYMQIGGHIELDETPWQAMMHELEEESGYRLEELQLLQPVKKIVQAKSTVTHPVPFSINTHLAGSNHFHSDLCYGFVAETVPQHSMSKGESEDIRWMTIAALKKGVAKKEVLEDVVEIYEYLSELLSVYYRVDAGDFSIKKPTINQITYKR